MRNPYEPPSSNVEDMLDPQNNSGGGRSVVPPSGVKGWSWGAFLLNWIWAIFNRTWVGLFCLVPYIGFIPAVYLGVFGRELAWKNKRWESIEHFNRVQRRWSIWGAILIVGIAGIGILAAIAIPAYHQYVLRARG